jgi:hypothetical protein
MVSIFVLLEKSGLCRSAFGFEKVAQPDADEPITLLRIEGHSFSQPQRDVRQFLARKGRRAGRMAASQDRELTGLQFEHHRARYPRFLAGSRPKLFCKAADYGLGFCQWYVVLKRIFDGYRLGRSVVDHVTVVNASGELV